MKNRFILICSLIALLASQYSFACCYPPKETHFSCHSCGYERNHCGCDSCAALEGCGGCGGWGGCGWSAVPPCTGPCSSCNCTDPACGCNPCISARECCQVFGNIGAGDLDFPCDCA